MEAKTSLALAVFESGLSFFEMGGKNFELGSGVLSLQHLACWVKLSAYDILKLFSYCSKRTGFDISCKLSNPVFLR